MEGGAGVDGLTVLGWRRMKGGGEEGWWGQTSLNHLVNK